ncbi:hypothetical protein JW848_03395 [Candidatus Bipolaricaulota bacterium]|nr:hypothetical protein [Candidatus Bipolaricaulota bacterium]
MRRGVWWAWSFVLLVSLSLSLCASAETIITSGGSVLQGTIEFGIPAVISVASSTGDIFTVQRTNIKAIVFNEAKETAVETFDGNILVGTLGGIPEVIGLRTSAGDIQSVRLESIQEIRFDPAAAVPAGPTTIPPVIAPTITSSLAAQVGELYLDRSTHFSLALDLGYQVALVGRNGFGYPTNAVGFDFITMGLDVRFYMPPSQADVEEVASTLVASTPGLSLDRLMEMTIEETLPRFDFYIQVGTWAFIFPEVGGGILIRITPSLFLDIGVSVDLSLATWPNLGVVWIF